MKEKPKSTLNTGCYVVACLFNRNANLSDGKADFRRFVLGTNF